MYVTRSQYVIYTNSPKKNGKSLSKNDLINVGYMAGRFGISLDGNLKENKIPKFSKNGTIIDVNSCTTSLLENNLTKDGIAFNKLA